MERADALKHNAAVAILKLVLAVSVLGWFRFRCFCGKFLVLHGLYSKVRQAYVVYGEKLVKREMS